MSPNATSTKWWQCIMAAILAVWTFSWLPKETIASCYPALLMFLAGDFGIYSYFNVKEKNGK